MFLISCVYVLDTNTIYLISAYLYLNVHIVCKYVLFII